MQTMLRRARVSLAAAALTVFAAPAAQAQLHFDDVATNAAGFNSSAFSSYNGFSFENFGVLTSTSTFGGGNNAVSAPQFAYAQADGSSFIYRTDARFNFASAFLSFREFDLNLTPAFVTVRGYRPGDVSATFEQQVQLSNSAQFFNFQFTDIEELEFETDFLQSNGRSAVLALDDVGVSVVPEPASIVLLACGLAGIVAVHARKRRAA